MKTIIKSFSLTIIAVVLVLFRANSQEIPAENSSKMTLSHLSFDAGLLFQFGQTLDRGQLKSVESTFGQPTDFSSYANGHQFGSFNGFAGSTLSLNWHFIKETQKRNLIWTVGIKYQNVEVGSAYLSYQERTPYDTLTSSQTGEEYYVDSVNTTNYSFYGASDILMVTSSFQLQRKFGSRMTLNHGVGIGIGASVRDYYRKNEATYSTIASPISSSYSQSTFYFPEDISSETTRTGDTFTFLLSAPIGFDFVLGKKRPFFQNTMLMFNLQPGLQGYFHQDLGTHFTPSLETAIGFKFNLKG